ncbi:MAG: hypothetical protein UR43_C0019G0039 [candidate division TM6 bacterium GW2011_GWF2_33_332]|nr:MAG: hypothetical protein UR43_C0019G0039 [candidate division TM6 bacterium GW2011_GWF2_33_332]
MFNIIEMKRKTHYYVVIDLYDLRKTTIEQSKIQVSVMVGKHRNTIDFEQDNIYGHYLVLPRYIKSRYINPPPGRIQNLIHK